MLSKKMEEAINAQINAEFWSAYLYLSMSCDFARKGLKGMANWFSLCELAAAEKDFASANRLVWFVDEQIEEEENVQGIIDALKLVGDDKVGTFMLDKELAGRVYASPVAG